MKGKKKINDMWYDSWTSSLYFVTHWAFFFPLFIEIWSLHIFRALIWYIHFKCFNEMHVLPIGWGMFIHILFWSFHKRMWFKEGWNKKHYLHIRGEASVQSIFLIIIGNYNFSIFSYYGSFKRNLISLNAENKIVWLILYSFDLL